MKKKPLVLSFIISKDENAHPTKRYILHICLDNRCTAAPRYPFMEDALTDLAGFIKEYAPEQKKVDIKIDYDYCKQHW